MQRDGAGLHVGADAHPPGRADQHRDLAGAAGLEQPARLQLGTT
jgi:hypothetical protein